MSYEKARELTEEIIRRLRFDYMSKDEKYHIVDVEREVMNALRRN